MPLELSHPLAFIDLESTGVSPERDRIVEIAILKLHPDVSLVPATAQAAAFDQMSAHCEKCKEPSG